MTDKKKDGRGRPRITGRWHPNKALYRCQLNLAGIETTNELQNRLCQAAGEVMSSAIIRKWQADGWPPDKWELLLNVLGMTKEQALEKMFLPEQREKYRL